MFYDGVGVCWGCEGCFGWGAGAGGVVLIPNIASKSVRSTKPPSDLGRAPVEGEVVLLVAGVGVVAFSFYLTGIGSG